jgi:NADH:ubiquinone oxidoreductase subunit 3 (subunit A)
MPANNDSSTEEILRYFGVTLLFVMFGLQAAYTNILIDDKLKHLSTISIFQTLVWLALALIAAFYPTRPKSGVEAPLVNSE